MPLSSIGCQTIWSFPPLYTVNSCPTPSNDSTTRLELPRKLQTVLIDRYTIDSAEPSLGCGQQDNMGGPTAASTTSTTDFEDSFFDNTDITEHSEELLVSPSTISKKPRLDRQDDLVQTDDIVSPGIAVSSSTTDMETEPRSTPLKPNRPIEYCQICGSKAAGFYCGAFVCEACKKFYMRACKQSNRSFVCSGRGGPVKGKCEISKSNRTSCTYCRYQKCLSVGMEPLGKGLLDTHSIKSLPCKVCGSFSSGFHFGVLTCEGCKGFFRRLLLDGSSKANSLVCAADGSCDVTVHSRSQCRACRYHKCISVGMSKNAARIGRQPNSVRYARIVENRQAKVEAADDISRDERVTSGNSRQQLDTISNTVSHELHDSNAALNEKVLSIEKAEYPIDLSISCFKSNSPELFSSTEFSLYQLQISRLAYIFQGSCSELYAANKDEQMIPHLNDDMALVHCNFVQFQRALRIFVSFAKKVTGFTLLDMEDRVLLTKCSLYRLLLISWSLKYELATGRHYMFAWKSWGEVPKRFTDIYPPYRVLSYHFDVIGRKIKLTECSAEELGLLAVLVTINTDNYNDLRNATAVTKIYNEYMNMLILMTKETHPTPTKRLQELNDLLRLLREAAKEHAVAAKTVIHQYPNYAAAHAKSAQVIPALYKEMFSSTPWNHQSSD